MHEPVIAVHPSHTPLYLGRRLLLQTSLSRDKFCTSSGWAAVICEPLCRPTWCTSFSNCCACAGAPSIQVRWTVDAGHDGPAYRRSGCYSPLLSYGRRPRIGTTSPCHSTRMRWTVRKALTSSTCPRLSRPRARRHRSKRHPHPRRSTHWRRRPRTRMPSCGCESKGRLYTMTTIMACSTSWVPLATAPACRIGRSSCSFPRQCHPRQY